MFGNLSLSTHQRQNVWCTKEEENFKAKGDIFSKRTITKAKVIDHVDTSLEALVLSMSEKGYVDFDYMGSLTGKDRPTLIEELRGEIYLNIREEQNFYRPLSFNPEDGDLPFAQAKGKSPSSRLKDNGL